MNGGSWINQTWITAQIFCDRVDSQLMKQKLYKIFQGDLYPSLPFRFIPSESISFLSSNGSNKHTLMLAKHKQVVAQLRSVQFEHVIRLDEPDLTGKTLRD